MNELFTVVDILSDVVILQSVTVFVLLITGIICMYLYHRKSLDYKYGREKKENTVREE